MKKLSFFLLLLFSFQITYAQLGLNVSYKQLSAPGWEKTIDAFNTINGETQSPLDKGLSVGVDYWFRLKKKRIEFTPELNYTRFSQSWSGAEGTAAEISSTFYSLYLNTNIYLFDLGNDCNCPTFDKDGDVLKKGFFFQLSPGISYVGNKFSNKVSEEDFDATDIAPSVGIGVGLDFGISKFLTVTPIISYRQNFGVNWENFHTYLPNDAALDGTSNENEASTLSFGIRIGMRFDELNKYGYR